MIITCLNPLCDFKIVVREKLDDELKKYLQGRSCPNCGTDLDENCISKELTKNDV